MQRIPNAPDTCLGEALLWFRKNMLTRAAGMRPNTPKKIIVMTDGLFFHDFRLYQCEFCRKLLHWTHSRLQKLSNGYCRISKSNQTNEKYRSLCDWGRTTVSCGFKRKSNRWRVLYEIRIRRNRIERLEKIHLWSQHIRRACQQVRNDVINS